MERAPHPRLRGFVDSYTGYRVDGMAPGMHAGLPSGSLTFIVSFDDPLDVAMRSDDADRQEIWAMVAGLHRVPARVRHEGRQHGVQLRITPLGADALFGVPAGALGSTLVGLDDVAPTFANELVDRLSSTDQWRTRFAILDEILLRALHETTGVSVEMQRAWDLLRRAHGDHSVDALASDVGLSRRHFSQKFKSTFGLTPKVMARILRFERAQKMIRLPTQPSLASVAAVCGYADQAHMTREWSEFAGAPPTAWIQDELLPTFQDPEAPTGRG